MILEKKFIEGKKNEVLITSFFMDLDTLSHMAGDQLLIDVSNRLQEHLSKHADLYRFGGDEFIIVLKNQTKDEVEKFVQKTIQLLGHRFYYS